MLLKEITASTAIAGVVQGLFTPALKRKKYKDGDELPNNGHGVRKYDCGHVYRCRCNQYHETYDMDGDCLTCKQKSLNKSIEGR